MHDRAGLPLGRGPHVGWLLEGFQRRAALMAYLGLVGGEDSSGETHRRGRITRTANTLVRSLAGGSGVALLPSTGHWRGAPPEAQRPTGAIIAMHTFGASAPLKELQTKFGFTPEKVVEAARAQIALAKR